MSLKYFMLFLIMCFQAFCSQEDFDKMCEELHDSQVSNRRRLDKICLDMARYAIRDECRERYENMLVEKAKSMGLMTKEKKLQTAKKFLKDGIPAERIAAALKLDVEEVKRLLDE